MRIIGHEKITQFLERAIQNDRVAHAYLFVGSEHVGKRTVAEWFACKLFSTTIEKLIQNPDFLELKRKVNEDGEQQKTISIDEIRDLKSQLGLSSFFNSWKIALIPDAETLTIQAANALLKILEEPSGKTCFIILAKHKDLLPKTIVSRSEVVRFNLVPSAITLNALVALGIANDRASELASLSCGLPGIALDFARNEEKYKEYMKFLGELATIGKLSVADRFSKGAEVLESKGIEETLDSLAFVLRNELLLQYNCNDRVLSGLRMQIDLSPAEALGKILKYKQYLQYNVNKNLILENILIHL